MPEPESPRNLPPSAERMIREVGTRQERIARARSQKNSILSSIAILGVIGWSVTLPTVLGVVLGVWIDRRWPGRFSWALTLLMAGLAIGCTSAWLRIRPRGGSGPRGGAGRTSDE
jgi:ATP synthase protein I